MEEKQSDQGCQRGKAKLQTMIERKSKVAEDVRWEKQSDQGCSSGKAKLQRMIYRKSKVTEDVVTEKQHYRECQRENKITKDVREEK